MKVTIEVKRNLTFPHPSFPHLCEYSLWTIPWQMIFCTKFIFHTLVNDKLLHGTLSLFLFMGFIARASNHRYMIIDSVMKLYGITFLSRPNFFLSLFNSVIYFNSHNVFWQNPFKFVISILNVSNLLIFKKLSRNTKPMTNEACS